MTHVEQLAEFVVKSSYADLSAEARDQLKIRVLDAIGCAIGALNAPPIRMIRTLVLDFGGSKRCTLMGHGESAPDRAAFYNSALVRYLDFNDAYLAKGETCHPSDNLGAILAAAEYANRRGRDLLTALAIAYQIQCRLSDVAPVRAKGFDHTTQGAYAVAAGVSKALGLNRIQTANAMAISGTANIALRVSRTGSLSHWKGLAYPNMAWGATNAAFLAKRGITGPSQVFEGNKGFMDTIAGHFEIDWSKQDLERVTQTIVKRYNAEIHSQSALEGILELKQEHQIDAAQVEKIEIEIFDVAYHIIGGGEEGDKRRVETKEQADHSLPYLVAVALLDGHVTPRQYRPERIVRPDVQQLLRRVSVRPLAEFSQRFPDEMPCRVTVKLRNASPLVKEKRDYEGFHTRPMQWDTLAHKFALLCEHRLGGTKRRQIVEAVQHLEDIKVKDLTRLLAKEN